MIENRSFILHYGDMTEPMKITIIIQEIQQNEIYNLSS
jgi:GDPmannose 4,6-dehydratase